MAAPDAGDSVPGDGQPHGSDGAGVAPGGVHTTEAGRATGADDAEGENTELDSAEVGNRWVLGRLVLHYPARDVAVLMDGFRARLHPDHGAAAATSRAGRATRPGHVAGREHVVRVRSGRAAGGELGPRAADAATWGSARSAGRHAVTAPQALWRPHREGLARSAWAAMGRQLVGR